MPLKQVTYEVLSKDIGRIDILIARLLDFSRARVRGLMDHGSVNLNGETCHNHGTTLAEGDLLTLTYDPQQRRYKEKTPERKPQGFSLVFRDEHLVVVDKDAGVLTVPTDRREQNSLVERLTHFLAAGQPRAPRVAVVHRLDRDTSGLLVFGRSHPIASQIIKQFTARKPEREYLAILSGELKSDKGEIRSYLATDKALNQRSRATGELAITHYRVISRQKNTTLVAVNLETGKRNQIRVHFAEKGHPILGDARYEPDQARHERWPYKRLALHARILGFTHPITTAPLRFESEMPEEFKRFLR